MNLQDALATLERDTKCKAGRWLATIDPGTAKEFDEAATTTPINRLYRAALVMGYDGSKPSWERHFGKDCGCVR